MSFDGHLPFVITAAVYVVALYNCYKVLGSRTTAPAAMAWILLHLTMPFVGIPLYFLVGDFRLKGYVKRHRSASAELESAGQLILPTPPPDPEAVPQKIRATYASFRQVLRRFGPVFEPQPGRADLLVDGRDVFDAIFDAIASAETYIFVQYYIVRHDRLGLELKRLLVEKAQKRIPVYVLYDDMGSFWLSREYIKDLRRAGVKTARFLPIASFKRFFQMNFRNHRKLVVVDGRVAFTGGLNVGEEYAARRSRKSLRYWRDTHLRVTGGAVAQLEDIFFEDWYFATDEKIEIAAKIRETAPVPLAESEARPPDPILQVVPTGPTDDALVSILFVMHVINSAMHRLWIATPYFVPDPALVRALELAVLRGVDVRIILPRRSDNTVVHWVSISYASELAGHGVKVLLFEPGFMHQKVMLADDVLAAVGTMNLDNRALYLNFETMVLVHGEAFATEVREMLEQDFLSCRYLAPDKRLIYRNLKKFRGNFFRLFAPLL